MLSGVGIELGTVGHWSVYTVRYPVYPVVLSARARYLSEVVDTILVLCFVAPGLGSDP